MYLSPDDGEYNWDICKAPEFRLEEFLMSHDSISRVGFVMTYEDGSGGEFLVSPTWLSFSASINRLYIDDVIPDFSGYLSKMVAVVKGFGVSRIRCELVV